MDSIFTGLLIALLTIVLNHTLQSRREQEQRTDAQKRRSIEDVVRSCQTVLDDASRHAQAARANDQQAISDIHSVLHIQGSAVTKVKADALLVYDPELRELAFQFLQNAGHLRKLVSEIRGQDPLIEAAIEKLNGDFGDVCDKGRSLLFSESENSLSSKIRFRKRVGLSTLDRE